jgi:hypothetical protein
MPMVVEAKVTCTECLQSFSMQRRGDGFWGVYHLTVAEVPCSYSGHWFALPACEPVAMEVPAVPAISVEEVPHV